MKTFRFRDFTIYRDARMFRKLVKEFLNRFPQEERYRLIDQIHRSCLSVILNIAEGSAKKSDKEFARFLETSIASINEVVAGFDIAFDDALISSKEMHIIEAQAEILTKQIGSFIKTLYQSSNIHPSLPTAKKPIANKPS